MATSVSSEFHGLWVPIITPFLDDGSLDTDGLHRLAARLLADGVDGLVALGTTGEAPTLSRVERRTVVEICDEVCREADCGLIVGAGTNCTEGTIEEIRFLTDGTRAVGALVVVPYYTRPSEKAIVEHFEMVADDSPVPVVMYNVPYRTGADVRAEALLAAIRHPNIHGLKQAVGALDVDTLAVLGGASDDFAVLAGDDAFIVATVLFGGSGAIAAAAHMCTPVFVAMVEAAHNADVSRSTELAQALLPVVRAGFAEPNPSVWKGALAAQGELASPTVRRPLTNAPATAVELLLAATARAQVSHVPGTCDT